MGQSVVCDWAAARKAVLKLNGLFTDKFLIASNRVGNVSSWRRIEPRTAMGACPQPHAFEKIIGHFFERNLR